MSVCFYYDNSGTGRFLWVIIRQKFDQSFSHSSYPKFDYTCDVLCFELIKPQTKEWDQNDPHSALLRNANDQIVCFYINFVLS